MEEQFIGDIIVFAAIALFVVLRYRSTLGQKKGHDFSQKPMQRAEVEEKVVQLPSATVANVMQQNQKEKELLEKLENDDITADITAMKELDASFTLDSFLSGARQAYEMIIEAFSNHDKNTLKMLLSKELYKDFEQEIDAQQKDERRNETTLVSIEEMEIVEAELSKSTARITVKVGSEQINVVRDKDNKILEGDASDIQNVQDEWIFERDLKSRNPNWTIIAT
ncbi:MAG: Tim44/TimA family putative adaptor protein [Rickettsiales bacterium]|nr:Tim44/TimA family putative adaptor protein [Rickettsiales bacterium]